MTNLMNIQASFLILSSGIFFSSMHQCFTFLVLQHLNTALCVASLFLFICTKVQLKSRVPIKNISSYSMAHCLNFFGTKFEIGLTGWDHDTDRGFHIRTMDCVRGIIVRNCTFVESGDAFLKQIYFNLGDKSSSDSTIALIVLMDDCFFGRFGIFFHVIPRTTSELSFLLVKMINVVFYDSFAVKDIDGGLAAFVVHNCSFIGSKSWPRALHVMNVLYVSVTNCIFQTYNLFCWQGCAISVRGVHSSSHTFNTFSKAFSFNTSRPTLIIEESQFIGSTAQLSGGSVSCVGAFLKVSNTVFQMTASSKPPSTGGLIYHEYSNYDLYNEADDFLVANVILNASNYIDRVSLVLFSGRGNIKSFSLFCPQSLQPDLILKLEAISISCETICLEAYTFQAGNTTLNITNFTWYDRTLSISNKKTVCFPCPVGAVCNGTVRALPNYWGYRNQIGLVTMIRCPDGYCCYDNKTCTEFNSCHPERTGTLCTICQKNLTESLFLPNCTETKNCHENLVLCLYTLVALIYTIFLLFGGIAKNKIIQIFKKCLQFMKSRNKHVGKSMDGSSSEGSSST